MNQQTIVKTETPADKLLRNALRGNALFSGMSGLAALLWTRPLTRFVGIEPALVFTILGIGLIIYGANILYFSTRENLNPKIVWAIILADVIWVLGSVIILLSGIPALTVAGNWLVAILAEAVAAFTITQYIGLRRIIN